MRTRFLIPAVLAASIASGWAMSSPAVADVKVPRVSPNATVTQTLGVTDLTVTYSRPGVKGRVIWGGLVPYDKPWRTGANEATTLTTTDEVQFGGKTLPAGKYALVTIPGKDEWTVALNSESDLWGAFEYKPEKDVLRIQVTPTAADPQEWMEFTFEDLTSNSAKLVLRWEKLQLAVPITQDVNARVLAGARTSMTALDSDAWREPFQAAQFCFNNDVALDEGRAWLDRSLRARENYSNLTLLARWQMKTGHKPLAIAAARKAIAAGKASTEKVDTSGTEKLLADWSAK
jgi:hypothetical protein